MKIVSAITLFFLVGMFLTGLISTFNDEDPTMGKIVVVGSGLGISLMCFLDHFSNLFRQHLQNQQQLLRSQNRTNELLEIRKGGKARQTDVSSSEIPANPIVKTESSQSAANVEVTNETNYYGEPVIRSDQSDREQQDKRAFDRLLAMFRKLQNEGWSALSGEEKSEALVIIGVLGSLVVILILLSYALNIQQ